MGYTDLPPSEPQFLGPCSHLGKKFVKAMSLDKLPYSPDSVKVEKDVMDRVQNRRENLSGNKQMP